MPEKKIIDRIDEIHMEIYKDPFGAGLRLAEDLQMKAFKATFKGATNPDGSPTPEWKDYMCNFASNAKQLERLCGGDKEWLQKNDWGAQALAYIVASSTCGIITTTGTRSNLSREMVEGLDEDIIRTIEDTDCPKGTENLDESVKYI